MKERRFTDRFQNFCLKLKIGDPNDTLFNILNEALRMARDELTISRKREVDKILVIYQDNFIVANSAIDEKNESYRFSRTVVRNVMKKNKSFLSNDIKAEASYRNLESVKNLDTHSLLCVPLRFIGECIGAIYADSLAIDGFSGEDLEFMEDFSWILSPYIYSIREYIEMKRSQERKKEVEIIGKSEALKSVLKTVEKIAPADTTVLIEGETGTGKELIAHLLHSRSPRRSKPFVPVNCAAIPSNLLESELFGHEKGAFTGAFGRKLGKFELAHDGTLFLDEVGELSPELQAKLLRVLENGQFERLGGTETLKVNLRLISATNKDLRKAIEEGTFREDLYYRLSVFPIALPPLRERQEDIYPLAAHFLEKYAKKQNKRGITMSSEAKEQLQRYRWPGNVRELENSVERAILLSDGDRIFPEHLGISLIKVEDKGIRKKSLQIWDEEIGRNGVKKILKEFIESCKGDLTMKKMKNVIHRASIDFDGDSRSTFYNYIHRCDLGQELEELKKSMREKRQ